MSAADAHIDRFERYVQMDPRNASLWVGYGDVLHAAGHFDRAEEAFRKSIELESNNPIATARLALVNISRGEFEAAERILRELIDSGEQHPAVRVNLGLSLYYARRFAEAAEVFAPLAANPEMEDARYHLLSCLHNLAQIDEAVSRAEVFLAERESPKLRGYLALLLMDGSRMSEALAHAKRTLDQQPANADAASVMSTHSIETQQMEDAERYLSVLMSREPRNVRVWQGKALIALYNSQHAEALSHLERARELDPENTGTLTTIGWVHLTAHQYAQAEKTFRDGIDVDRNDAELHGGLATALVFQRHVDEARQEIARALRLDKACFGATFAQSILLKLDGREALARRLLGGMLQKSARADGPSLLEGLTQYLKQRQVPAVKPAGSVERRP